MKQSFPHLKMTGGNKPMTAAMKHHKRSVSQISSDLTTSSVLKIRDFDMTTSEYPTSSYSQTQRRSSDTFFLNELQRLDKELDKKEIELEQIKHSNFSHQNMCEKECDVYK